MRMKLLHKPFGFFCGLAAGMLLAMGGAARGDIAAVQKDFQSPPDDAGSWCAGGGLGRR